MTTSAAAHAASAPVTDPVSVHLRAARFAHHDELLFDNLNLDLEGGCFTCLLGPSGVGKSSLLRLLAGLAPEIAATKMYCGSGLALTGRVAYMAQQDLLLPWLTVLDNITLGSRLRGETANLSRARSLLERVGLADSAKARPNALSGGMRQRAALVRTLMENRPIVLMDEPFSAVDALTRLRLQDLAARLLEDRTVLMVTHDPIEALRLGKHILIMNGRPAYLRPLPDLPGDLPRDPGEPSVQATYRDILRRLAVEP